MTQIILPEFFDYDSKDIYIFLFQQEDAEFEIIIPRLEMEDEPVNDILAHEYLYAAFAGQLLSGIARNFSYFVPGPITNEGFNFRILVADLEKFADTLYLIIQGYNEKSDDSGKMKLNFKFSDDASEFLNNSLDEFYDCNVWGLLFMVNKLLDREPPG